MKSEHRHELKENDLGKLTMHAQGFFEKHGNQVLLGAIGAVLLIGGLTFWFTSSSSKATAGWSKYSEASTATDFAEVADAFPGTEVAQWSRLNEAENYLFNGLQLTFKDRKSGLTDLEKAKSEFDAILNGTPLPPQVRERALFGLARTLETTSDKDTDKAIAAYEALQKDFPESTYTSLAKQRIEALKKGSTQSFYAWFHEQKPALEDRTKPKDGFPPGFPGLPSDHPSLDMNLDDMIRKKPAEKEEAPQDLPKEVPADLPKETEPKAEKPAEPEAKPEEKKAEEKKSEDKKSDDKKPE